MSDSTNTNHPLLFSSSSDGLTPYNVNVVTSMEAAGTSNAHVTITVADDAPNELFVYRKITEQEWVFQLQ